MVKCSSSDSRSVSQSDRRSSSAQREIINQNFLIVPAVPHIKYVSDIIEQKGYIITCEKNPHPSLPQRFVTYNTTAKVCDYKTQIKSFVTFITQSKVCDVYDTTAKVYDFYNTKKDL